MLNIEKMNIIEITIEEFKEKIYKEYIELFPQEEQRQWEKIKESYEKGIEKFYKIVNDDNIIGFIMLEKLTEKYPYYMDYFAIFKKYQGKGFGTKAIKLLLNNVIKDNGLYIEIEKEDMNEISTIKRAKFYRELSFQEVDSEYLLYNVYYTPYVYSKNLKLDKTEIDKIMFDYYIANCGKKEVEKNCSLIK